MPKGAARTGSLRELCFRVACRHARPGTDLVDLGCGRGEDLARLAERFGRRNRYVGVEAWPAMQAAARERFRGLIDCQAAEIRALDLRQA